MGSRGVCAVCGSDWDHGLDGGELEIAIDVRLPVEGKGYVLFEGVLCYDCLEKLNLKKVGTSED